MRDLLRLIATLFIWSMVGGVMIAAMISSTAIGGGNLVALVLFLSVAAALSTLAVWFGGGRVDAPAASGKSKRAHPRRVERLIDELDDDEIYDLEALLLAREQPAERRHPRE